MLRAIVLIVGAFTLLAACGSDENERAAPAETQARTQEKTGVTDQTQIRALGTKYIEAYAKKDWGTVCSTLSPRARARFKRKAGSCQKVYEQAPAKSVRFAKDQEIMDVRMRGDDRAVMTIGTHYSDRVEGRMYAAKLDGRWFLYIKRAAQGAP